MRHENTLPIPHTFAGILTSVSTLGDAFTRKQAHCLAFKLGYLSDVFVGSSLLNMYCKAGGHLDDARKTIVKEAVGVFRVMLWERGEDVNEFVFTSVLSAIALPEFIYVGKQIHGLSLKNGFLWTVSVANATVTIHMGLVDRGWNIFKMMSDEFGIEPMLEHFACMVDMFGRAGKLYEAKEFIESAANHVDHGLCLWRILLSSCRNYRNYELGAYAGEKLMELGSQESSAYVLLSSIYSALGRLEDVERVRRLMNLRGVSKEPGCSWIELKSQFHVFVVGDQLHPQIVDIHEELWRLSKPMKDEGHN
ncbi:hypothetical protein K7X08_033682 [Anisodus acutangulus]|uniref:Pentatricopeptide repeat-containing protein n=1 Tax=Anisodus acutangulus TaxID=402998 RepID=A0A9Q1RAC1_9SOLA|nr:hypothetical protein K7X08_033682 [Anisodus acutangulus]